LARPRRNYAFHAIYAIAIKIGKIDVQSSGAIARCSHLRCCRRWQPLSHRTQVVVLHVDRRVIYLTAVKPFIDSVNMGRNGLIEIHAFTSGSLGKSYAGKRNWFWMAWPILRLSIRPDARAIFPTIRDGLPGLFRDVREASIVYTRWWPREHYGDTAISFIVGAIGRRAAKHTHASPVSSLTDCAAKKSAPPIKRRSGARCPRMSAEVMPINATADAISRGDIDGTTVPASMLVNFGISRVTSYHYFIRLGFARSCS